MTIVVPAARKLSEQTGEYDVTDEATSGGDIGVQIALFPVVWVSRQRLEHRWSAITATRPHECCGGAATAEGRPPIPRRSKSFVDPRERPARVRLGGLELLST